MSNLPNHIEEWLSVAAALGNQADVKAFLSFPGVNPNKTLESGGFPLWYAVGAGHLDTVALLLSHPSIDVNQTIPSSDISVLHVTALENFEDIAVALVACGADLEHTHANGFNALRIAIRECNCGLVALLLHCGANPDHRYPDADQPLYHASCSERIDSVLALLIHGAGVDDNGLFKARSAAIVRALESRCVDVVIALLACGASVNEFFPSARSAGATLLQIASLEENWSVEDYAALLACDADVCQSGGGITALHCAAYYGPAEGVKMLLDKNANVNCTADGFATYNTPLLGAYDAASRSLANSLSITQMLFEHGADFVQVRPGIRVRLNNHLPPDLHTFVAQHQRNAFACFRRRLAVLSLLQDAELQNMANPNSSVNAFSKIHPGLVSVISAMVAATWPPEQQSDGTQPSNRA